MSDARLPSGRDLTLIVAVVGLIVALLADGLQGTRWLFGGAATTEAAIASLGLQMTRLTDEVNKIGRRLDDAPRVTDFQERDRRLSDLGTHVDLLQGRVDHVETDAAATRERLAALTEAVRPRPTAR